MRKGIYFAIAILAVLLFSGCEVGGDALGGAPMGPYVFDTPAWIQGSWSNELEYLWK